MALEPIKKVNITKQVFEQLKNNILAGKWKVGEKIPSETELSAIFEVSRSTVRQALRSLADYGLIEVRLGAGSFVKQQDTGLYINGMMRSKLGKRDLLEVLDFCCIMENNLAAAAARQATDEDVEELKRIQEEIEAADNDFEKMATLDKQFHLKLAAMTGNSLVMQTYTILSDPLEMTIYEMYVTLGSTEGLMYHRRLIEAMDSRDEKLAWEMMDAHTKNRKEKYLLICKDLEEKENEQEI